MKKWIYIGIGVLVVVVAIIIFGVSNLGPIIKRAVNSYGPEITKTDLHVGGVSVSLFSGEAKIKNFFLGNPAGFKSPSAMKIGSVLVKIDEKSLRENPIIVDQIEVLSPEITYEKKGGTDNFHAILNNIAKTTNTEKQSAKKPGKQATGKNIVIRNFVIKNGKVNLALSAYGLGKKQISCPLPDIHLTNIGEKKKGVSPADAFKQIVASLYGKITSPAVTDVLNKQLKSVGATLNSLGKGAVGKIQETTGGAKEKVTEVGKSIKSIFNK